MNLTADNVKKTMMHVLPKEEELTEETRNTLKAGGEVEGIKIVHGVRAKFAFNTKRLEEKREDVKSMLNDLPKQFHTGEGGGGGWSFLNACMTKDDVQWGEQRTVDDLICLGIGLGMASFTLPREAWAVLPGSVPYFSVTTS